jgi:hypothetical protein
LDGTDWLAAVVRQFEAARELAEGALEQVGDADFARVPAPGANSLAVLVHHVGGNLRSRWTDFLASDGEKPDRDRDSEFEEGLLTRAQCGEIWERGWAACLGTLRALRPGDLQRSVTIRGEPWGVVAAIHRNLSHTDYHTGQIVQLARHWAGPRWRTLSIPRGESVAFRDRMRRRHGAR